MRLWIEHDGEELADPEMATVRRFVASDQLFWLDVEDPSDELIEQLAAALDLHSLAIEDSRKFDQRGKLVIYENVAMLVGFGFDRATETPIEVHAYLGDHWLVTIHRDPSRAVDALRESGSISELLRTGPILALHRLIDSLHDDLPPYVAELQERLTAVEAEMLQQPLDRHLVEIMQIRQSAAQLGRVLTPGRDLAARASLVMSLPGATDDASLYANDIADEMRLIVADLAGIADHCVGALALHASLVSNQQAAASRQLAAVATVFLPITFVVGFFGMNFDVLVNDVEQGVVAFLLLGLALNVVAIAGTVWWLRRRGWQ